MNNAAALILSLIVFVLGIVAAGIGAALMLPTIAVPAAIAAFMAIRAGFEAIDRAASF